ncbi:kinase-like domain-containing protein [Lasiosphaeria hispida]|uniref:EKC/KEOPS complex subunit BUD32 n=1 Tax=Lasiosphaeria hispida TaxID=260671 RepID=A0AAJ0MEW4_9PEZI|nr:kinase-like domain-containing protein [Lasiosphaeria hispida]
MVGKSLSSAAHRATSVVPQYPQPEAHFPVANLDISGDEMSLHSPSPEAELENADLGFPAPPARPGVYYQLENEHIVAESLDDYCSGGFHPVHIGDCLGSGGRFRVLHKLGDGGFATVWLCRDKLTNKLRAVKINAAGAFTKPQRQCERAEITEQANVPEKTNTIIEFEISQVFSGYSSEELAANGIALPLEYFWLEGPNGWHLCAVLPFFGPRLTNLFQVYAHCEELLKDICFQLALSMRFLHSHGICHGDFRPANVLLQLAEGVDDWTDEELLAAVGAPETIPIMAVGGEHSPNVPRYLVSGLDIEFGSGLCSTKTAVADFGVAYRADRPPLSSGIPLPYAPPEDIFQRSSMGFASDIWSLGCTISQIRLSHLPFHEDADVDETIGEMEATIGPLPLLYRDSWKHEFQYDFANDEFDESLPVYRTVHGFEMAREERVSINDSGNLLEFSLKQPRVTVLTPAMMEHISKQLFQATGVLPQYSPTLGELLAHLPFHERFQYRLSKEEAAQLFDLLIGIFKWLPEDRLSTEQIVNHPWFGYRNLCFYRA